MSENRSPRIFSGGGEFLFTPPPPFDNASDATSHALVLTALSARLALEERTLVAHKTGRMENVAEHSFMLALTAPDIAELLYPNLDSNLVARYATVHDVVEAYVGDTPTHEIDAAGQLAKERREQLGLKQLRADFAHLPSFARVVSDYEEQVIPEARFVRVLDKLMPLLVHFAEGGNTLRGHIDAAGLLENSRAKAESLRRAYPEFSTLIDCREELAELAVRTFYE